MSGKLLNELKERLDAKTIHDLRQVARAVGVPRPADGKKERILNCIMDIAAGNFDPVVPSNSGAHPKSNEYDRQAVADVFRCREICLAGEATEESNFELSVASGEDFDRFAFTAEGTLYVSGGKWFMNVRGLRDKGITEVFVSNYFINTLKLREGDWVKGDCKRESLDEIAGLSCVLSVNDVAPESLHDRKEIDKLVPVYPDKKIHLYGENATCRIINLLSPLGEGQRAFVTGAHACGKTSVLRDIASGLKDYGDIKLIVALIDAAPEEAAEFRRIVPEKNVFVSPFEAGSSGHVATARMALDHAKRQAETHGKAVLIIDDLTRLAKAFNCIGRQVCQPIDPSATDSVKSFLASAKNTEEGISLTLISALSESGDEADEAVYKALKGVCNMRVALSSKIARMRIYPPMDIDNTYAIGDEKLLSDNELKTADTLRGYGAEKIVGLVKDTKDNDELCKQVLN